MKSYRKKEGCKSKVNYYKFFFNIFWCDVGGDFAIFQKGFKKCKIIFTFLPLPEEAVATLAFKHAEMRHLS